MIYIPLIFHQKDLLINIGRVIIPFRINLVTLLVTSLVYLRICPIEHYSDFRIQQTNNLQDTIVQKFQSHGAYILLVTIFQKFVIIYFCRDLNFITSITIVVVGNKYNNICQKNICQNPNQTTKYLMLLCGLLCQNKETLHIIVSGIGVDS